MKKILMGAAAALAIAAPGIASADTTGNVAFSYNTLDDDNDGFKEDYLSLSGAVATDLNNGWTLQFDADLGDMNHDGHTDNFSTATVHAFTRNDSYAYGGFAGLTSDETSGFYIGGEGAMYFNRFTLSANALVGKNRESSDEEFQSIAANGDYFVTDNFSIGADLSYHNFDFGGGSEQDGTIYGVNAEYQFAGSGFSVFGGYHESDLDDFGTDNEVSSFTIGGRYNFGTGSLLERDRSGASMRGGSQLPRAQIFSW
jgi:hypothetical protein